MASVKQLVEEPVVPLYIDPFNPVFVMPNPLAVSDEQRANIKAILEICCSDSRFAEKAYNAIILTLTAESVTPILTSLTPDTEVAGTPAVVVTVAGENFEAGSVVLQAGAPVNTNFVSDIELTATLDLSGAIAGVLAISVRNSSQLTSNVMNFTVSEPAGQSVPPPPKAFKPSDKLQSSDKFQPEEKKGEKK